MTNNLPPRVARRRGLSLLELTVVIATLISLITVLVIGTRAWKRGSDRSACIMTLRNVQVAARSYQNMYGYEYGSQPAPADGTRDIAEHLYNKGYIEASLYAQTRGKSPCASGGIYSCPLPDLFPRAGKLYMECSLAAVEDHQPTGHDDW